jgi:hypothetical protein
MKCGCYVVYEKRKKKGSGKLYMKAVKTVTPFHVQRGVIERPENSVVCDGDIIINVSAIEEPYFEEGSSPVLEVEAKCNKCGNTDFSEILNMYSNNEDISYLAMKGIANITEEERQEIIQRKIAEENKLMPHQFLSHLKRGRNSKTNRRRQNKRKTVNKKELKLCLFKFI